MVPDGIAFVLTSSKERAGVPLRKEALPRAQQDRVDDQNDFVRKPMFEQRRRQRGATREDEVRAILRLGEQVLADPERLDVLDVRFDYGEERFVSYGKVEGRVWVCVFTKRGEAYRPISVRKANARETRRYEETPRP